MSISNDILVRPNGGPAPAAAVTPPPGNQTVLFERTWSTSVLGKPLSLELRIISQDSRYVFQVVSDILGQKQSFAFTVNADTTKKIPLPYGLALDITISEWKPTTTQISFHLLIGVGLPFGLPSVTVANLPVSIPIRTPEDLLRMAAAPQSAADFAALLQLAAMASAPAGQLVAGSPYPGGGLVTPAGSPIMRAARALPASATPGQVSDLFPDGLLMPYSGGVFGLSATYFSEQYDPGNLLTRLPPGWVRSHVTVGKHDPKEGGWCAFIGWVSADDPTTADFKVHVGCPAFQGGTVECHVYVVST